MSSKVYKLTRHQKTQQNFVGEEVAFNPKDFPFVSENDILEIFTPDEKSPRLLLTVKKGSLREDFPRKDVISIEESIANLFQLRSYSDVIVRKVAVEDVELDSLELTFKDQYLGRSEMWRLKNSLVDTCVHLNKKIEYASSSIRCQVCEMWSHGDKVASGIVTSATKIVFRSSTSMVYLFIQMSSEMWEFDIYGDLYFEKAVNGFIADLFGKWKENGSNHEVTIVLFSRVYFEAHSVDQFPESVRDCLQVDYKGRIYEDYYRVAVQNERFDDWGSTLLHLKHIFVDYYDCLLNLHVKAGEGSKMRLPRPVVSSAAQGNFLEVLNMSLNVFEKHYMDRSFDRTGQLSVVITPGVGVFEVDRDLTNVTMQRIIDNGVGSDLVCVGEQPLHAVPLLKFNSKSSAYTNIEDYSLPHWINLSFYSTNKKVGYSSYTPRIKFPMNTSQQYTPIQSKYWDPVVRNRHDKPRHNNNENSWPNSNYDFDDYDAKIFQPALRTLPRKSAQRKKSSSYTENNVKRTFRRQNSEPEIYQANPEFVLANSNAGADKVMSNSSITLNNISSPAISIPAKRFVNLDHAYSSSFGTLNTEAKQKFNKHNKWHYDDSYTTQGLRKAESPCSSSHGGSPKEELSYARRGKDARLPSRALINPFDPSHAVIKLTSNRRRWTHIFPRGPGGLLIQQHHFHSSYPKLEIVHESLDSVDGTSSPGLENGGRSGRNSVTRQGSDGNLGNRTLTLLWGATGEQEWTPAMQTGVDWKSLTIPACLPITTDYFPDERSLQIDYVVSDYSLLPDDVNADYAQQRAVYRRPLTVKEVFDEIISQRLAQGFQLIVGPNEKKVANSSKSPACMGSVFPNEKISEEHCLSIGRVFHKIRLDGSTITVTRYRPRAFTADNRSHVGQAICIRYQYRFYAPNNEDYQESRAEFSTEKLENYNWNYLDHYICTRGDRDFALVETLKYWRFRMFLLPPFQQSTRKHVDGSRDDAPTQVEGFLKFIETCINRIRRPNYSYSPRKLSRQLHPSGGQSSTQSGQVFRERVGSNRLMERPRVRSVSKTERWATGREGSGRVSPAESNFADLKGIVHQAESIQDGGQQSSTNPDDASQEFKLKATASLADIATAMCSQNNGFSFIKSLDLPEWTFVSFDAVSWLMGHMEGITSESQAVGKFNEMLNDRSISHASGDTGHPFINGFYLYYILAKNQDGSMYLRQQNLDMFRNEWMEVAVHCEREAGVDKLKSTTPIMSDSVKPDVPKDSPNEIYRDNSDPLFKDVYLDVDVSNKSDRQEWAHVRYQTYYKPDEAFELAVHWVQATGSIISELVQGWSRKAQQCNMQLIPIPSDPFALPCSLKSDSLRGPIFIPLDINVFTDSKQNAYAHGCGEGLWKNNLISVQDKIVCHFGFIRSVRPTDIQISDHNTEDESSGNRYYVHSSGNMFVLIMETSASEEIWRNICKKNSIPKNDIPNDDSSPTTDFQNTPYLREKIGFLWSWNYMVSKRWKTSSTPALGDDAYMMRLLKDFQAFCANQNGRLQQFLAAATCASRSIIL